MSLRNSVLIWICCFVLVVVAIVVFNANFKDIETKTAQLNVIDEPMLEGLNAPSPSTQPHRVVSTAREDLIMAVKRSRELLKQKNELYNKQKTQLISRINDYDKLQTENTRLNEENEQLKRQFNELWRDADSSLMMFGEFLEQGVDAPPKDVASDADSNSEGKTNVPNGDAAEQSPTANNEEARVEMAVLQWQLEHAQGEVSELEASFDRMSQISNAASMILVNLGPATVPLLVELLDEREPIGVRVWAAWMLGNMGSTAMEATEPLNRLRVDPNAELAKVAEESLTRIKNN